MKNKDAGVRQTQFPTVIVDNAFDEISLSMLQRGITLRLPALPTDSSYSLANFVFIERLGNGVVVTAKVVPGSDTTAFFESTVLERFREGMKVNAHALLAVPDQEGLFFETPGTDYTIVP